jgi:signal transduction histidine kinase
VRSSASVLGSIGFGAFVSVLAAALAAGMSWYLYDYTAGLLAGQLRERLLTVARTQASQIDLDDVRALQEPDDWKTPAWERLVGQLKRAKDRNPDVVYLYLFRRSADDPDALEFVADAESLDPFANTDDDPANDVDANGDKKIEPDGADKLQWPGQPYPEPPEEAFLAFSGAAISREPYVDDWGSVLTAYEPLHDERGRPVAVLATDIRTVDFRAATLSFLQPFLLFMGFLIVLLLALAFSLLYLWRRQVAVLQEVDRRKDAIISLVNHQIVGPLNGIGWMLEEIGPRLPKEWTKEAKTLQTSVADVVELASSMLIFARAQLGRLDAHPEPGDAAVLLREVADLARVAAERKGVTLEAELPEPPLPARIDRKLLRTVLDNLLSNAVKYTPSGGKVTFKAETSRSRLYVRVEDTGIGIPLEQQARIFENGFRAGNVGEIPGSGFGLYIVKAAAEAQGGTVSFASTPGQGTTFRVEIPLPPQ